jgi:hypothetical protein
MTAKQTTKVDAIEMTGDDLFEWWSERAAIREFDGEMNRSDAESEATKDVRRRSLRNE